MSDGIFISVILVAYNARGTIGRCLESLAPQLNNPAYQAEVILVDSSDDATADYVRAEFPWVRLFQYAERQLVGNARNLGAAQAHGNVLAFTDADCVTAPDWLAALAAAHQQWDVPAIGGVVDHVQSGGLIAWANYFCEYTQWLPQTETQPMDDIPGACYSVKRWAFEKYGPFLENTYSSDTAFNWKMQRDGHRPLFVPAVRVSHISLYNLKTLLIKKIQHGRYFARVRVAEKQLNLGWRLVLAASLPVLPFLLFYRRARLVLKHPPYLSAFITAAPLVWLALVAWSSGEAWGYLAGAYAPAKTILASASIPSAD
jgi:glycosyltransferase involved in cell wall biosynthesis